MDKRFLTAFLVPERWCVKGYWLAPYSIDHIIKLHALNHPLVRSEVPNPAEVMLFLRVCHEKRHDFFHLKPHIVDKMFIWKMQKNPEFYKEVLEAIATYITEYSSVPKVLEAADSQRQENNPPIPHLLSLAGVLICKTSLTEREVLTMPYGRAVWYSIVVARMEGADIKTLSTDIEENAESDKAGMEKHLQKVKEQLRLAMVNGQIPNKKIR